VIPISFRARALRLGLVAIALARSGSALADDEETPPRCRGTFGLSSPLPDACLRVIDTDRPHQTDTPHVVPAGHAQFESAIAAAQIGAFAGGSRTHLLFFENAYKFGLVSRVDLQLIVKHAEYDADAHKLAPPGPFSIRGKINLVEEDGAVPAVTLVPWIFLPADRSQSLRGGPLLFWGWELPARFELEMNAGVFFGDRPKPPAAAVLASALTWTAIGNFRVFADVYATGWDIALGTGALWAFARDMQVDLGTYVGVSGDEPRATPFVGFSVRR
jgi:hypothetical protein